MSIKWDERLKLGIEFMDIEHKMIMEKMISLMKSIDFDLPSDDDADRFYEFEEAMALHFEHEELMMRQYTYPDIEKHLKSHNRILDRINRYKEKYYTTGFEESDIKRIDSDVNYLFKMHLLEEDRDLEVFVHEKMEKEKLPVK